jgi:hypothetical protein
VAWGKELGYFLANHVTNVTLLVDPATNALPINPAERMTLTFTRGWRDGNPETNQP